MRPRIVVSWDDTIIDRHKNCYFDLSGSIFLKNYHFGVASNIISGSTGEEVSEHNCLEIDLVTGSFTKSMIGSQYKIGDTWIPGVYTGSFVIPSSDTTPLFKSSALHAGLTDAIDCTGVADDDIFILTVPISAGGDGVAHSFKFVNTNVTSVGAGNFGIARDIAGTAAKAAAAVVDAINGIVNSAVGYNNGSLGTNLVANTIGVTANVSLTNSARIHLTSSIAGTGGHVSVLAAVADAGFEAPAQASATNAIDVDGLGDSSGDTSITFTVPSTVSGGEGDTIILFDDDQTTTPEATTNTIAIGISGLTDTDIRDILVNVINGVFSHDNAEAATGGNGQTGVVGVTADASGTKKITLTATTAGNEGNDITVADTSGHDIIDVETLSGGDNLLLEDAMSGGTGTTIGTIASFIAQSGSITFKEYWRNNRKTVGYHTGSLTIKRIPRSSFDMTARKLSAWVTNMSDTYKSSDVVTFRLYASDFAEESKSYKKPIKTDSVVLDEVYYRVKDTDSGKIVIPFVTDNNGTRLSTDSGGMFFDFRMSSLQVGVTYAFDFLVKDRGFEFVIEDRRSRFRIRS
jgi:hypothetical protein